MGPAGSQVSKVQFLSNYFYSTRRDVQTSLTKTVRATFKSLVEHIARGLTFLGSLILPTESIYDNLSTIS